MSEITLRILFGLLISIGDYLLSYRYYLKRRGVDRHRECLLSIETLLDANTEGVTSHIDDVNYGQAVTVVQDYLSVEGILQTDAGFMKNFRSAFFKFSHNEKINNSSLMTLFIVALVLEFTYDLLLGFYLASLQGHGVLSSLFANLYQVPILFSGLFLGRYVKQVLHWFLVSGEKRAIEKTIKQCITNTPLLDHVMEYQNGVNSKSENDVTEFGLILSKKGKRIFNQLKEVSSALGETGKRIVDDIAHYQENVRQTHQKEKTVRATQFDDITKGR